MNKNLIANVRKILNSEDILVKNSPNYIAVEEAFKFHPLINKIEYITIKIVEHKGNKNFSFVNKNGEEKILTISDLGKSLSSFNKEKFRGFISHQITEFKTIFEKPKKCPLCGKETQNFHVDHYFPMFHTILEKFMEKKALNIEEIINFTSDLKNEWTFYHYLQTRCDTESINSSSEASTRLRWICAECNLKRTKFDESAERYLELIVHTYQFVEKKDIELEELREFKNKQLNKGFFSRLHDLFFGIK
jgi:rubrerythrin